MLIYLSLFLALAESLRSGVDQTELQELNELGLILGTVPSVPRDSKRASISRDEHTDCTCGTAETGTGTGTGTGTSDCQCDAASEKAPKVKRQERKEPLESLEDSHEPNKQKVELFQQNELKQEEAQPKETETSTNEVSIERRRTNIPSSNIIMKFARLVGNCIS